MLERIDAASEYHAGLISFYHALRPLRFVVDTTCRPLLKSLDRLLDQGACDRLLLDPSVPGNDVIPARPDATFLEKRLATIGRQVTAREAHFGVWIDGAGESCRLVDQSGASVSTARLTRLLAVYLHRQKPDGLVEPMLVLAGDPTREATMDIIESSGAVCAAGADGRYWFAENAPAPDALWALSLVLSILSESDRTMSAVLDAA
jgi:phosphomannomutase